MAMIDRTPLLVICDAGPLIHLDEGGCLDLLSDFPEVLLPPRVWQEVERHRPAALVCPGISFKMVPPQHPENPALEALSQVLTLHAGERQALHVALEYPSGLLLTDDTAARLAAGGLAIKSHGTLGILVRAIRRNQRSKEQILSILRCMPEKSSLHLKRSLLDAVITEVEKSA